MTWGITIPVEGYDGKRIYVWYDAVIGYLSASKEWAAITGQPDAWRQWWDSTENPDARAYYFIGKDNTPFHSIIWPAMLIGYGGLNLPHDVPANEYLNMKGRKFSKSRGTMISIRSVLERYQPDAWRYALTAMAPEGNDVNFTWDDFVERVNNELIANWGNLVNRVVPFAYKRFNAEVPEGKLPDDMDRHLLNEIRNGFDKVASLYDGCRFKAALIEVSRLTHLVNQYITEKAPFALIKTDAEAAATVVRTALQGITWLNTMWAPILPHSAQSVWEMLGFDGLLFGSQFVERITDARGEHLVLRYDHAGAIGQWEAVTLPTGQHLRKPQALFTKLEPETAERETEGQESS
jgi:methionyl-tRNA synthetase